MTSSSRLIKRYRCRIVTRWPCRPAALCRRTRARDRDNGIASLRLDKPVTCHPLMQGAAVLGSLVLILAVDQEAAPSVRLTVVHRMLRTPDGLAPVPDLASHQIDPGAVALDAD